MSEKQPVIKFSPFEALLIGEKNKILKRQPMKNTIFVTRLNHQRKTINLRDLFGLEKDSRIDNKKDGIFKMPQRVRDFLRNRKLQNKSINATVNNKKDVLCYEFEGQKILTKNNESLKSRGKNTKLKSNKVKFKRKFKFKEGLRDKVVRKFPNYPKRNNYCYYNFKIKSGLPRLASNNVTKKTFMGHRHSLRGKDGKFICKSEYDKTESKEISTKQRYLSNYLHQLYLKKNKQFVENEELPNDLNLTEFQMPYSLETVIGFPNSQKQFDIIGSEATLNEVSEKYYENNRLEDFQFPKLSKQLDISDFEEDNNLLDIVYEHFPKSVKFGCKSFCDDFSEALLSTEILKPEKNLKMYEKKKNGIVKNEKVTVILDSHLSCLKLRSLNDIKCNHSLIKRERNGYSSKIDEPYTKKSHLINGKSLGSFFFRSAEGKDVFIGNLVKPFVNNSWFGSLPEF